MSAPLVSCVIAVFNGEKYLREAIDSVLAQTWQPTELVVVDDGSLDSSAAIAASYGPRLRLLRQANAGVSVARNAGVAASSGQMLCFLDADDWLESDKIEQQVARLCAEPALDLCDCQSRNFWSPELDAERLQREHRHREFIDRLDHGHISTWLMRRSLFESVGGFTPGMAYSEDIDFLSRCRDGGMRGATLPAALAWRRLHDANATSGDAAMQGAALAATMKAHLDRLRALKARG
jgi:glycosyltransferase involved in cell wall biosynthesis